MSRLHDNGKKSIAEYLEAEASEVLDGEDDEKNIPAQNMWVLREELDKRLNKIKAGTAHTGFGAGEHTYSVSCSMAMLALQEVCQAHCEKHCKKSKKKAATMCPSRSYLRSRTAQKSEI